MCAVAAAALLEKSAAEITSLAESELIELANDPPERKQFTRFLKSAGVSVSGKFSAATAAKSSRKHAIESALDKKSIESALWAAGISAEVLDRNDLSGMLKGTLAVNRVGCEPAASVAPLLRRLSECGVRFAKGVSENLLAVDAAQFAVNSYQAVLVALGDDVPGRPSKHMSNNVWHFDTECIEDQGDYVRISQRMRDLAGWVLPIKAIKDQVDHDEQTAALAFMLDGAAHRWELKMNDDWVDPAVFSRFVDLLASRKSGKRFTYLSLGGQDCLIGCSTTEELKKLKKLTGLPFAWLGDESFDGGQL